MCTLEDRESNTRRYCSSAKHNAKLQRNIACMKDISDMSNNKIRVPKDKAFLHTTFFWQHNSANKKLPPEILPVSILLWKPTVYLVTSVFTYEKAIVLPSINIYPVIIALFRVVFCLFSFQLFHTNNWAFIELCIFYKFKYIVLHFTWAFVL